MDWISELLKGLRRIFVEVNGMGADPGVDPFVYLVSSTNIANAGTAQASLRIESDAHFVWTHAVARVLYTSSKAPVLALMGDSTNKLTGGGGPLSWPFKVRLTTTGSGRDLMNAPLPLGMVFGADAGLPMALPRPKALGKSTTLAIELERYGIGAVEPDGTIGAATPSSDGFDVEMAFIGVKVYDSTRKDLTGLRN